MRSPIVILLALFILSACAAQPIDVHITCLPLTTYTLGEQVEFAAELDAIKETGKYPTVIRFLGDYSASRAADRACMAGGKP